MNISIAMWAGLVLSFIATFLLSLFHVSISSFSKISLSSYLEDKEKKFRLQVLDLYDEIKISIEFIRLIFLIAFLIYVYTALPRLRFWPLWLFLIFLAIYLLFFDCIPRLLVSLNKKKILGFFLPSFRLLYILSTPLFILSKKLIEKGGKEENDEERETPSGEMKKEQ
jgi:putative hemolysin